MESSGDLDPEILDNLYLHQLNELRAFTFKLEDTQDINLCRKWLQVFHKTSEDEKVARNSLCALLCQQLQNNGCLSVPFTDLSNCNRNLTQVLAKLDETVCSETHSIQTTRRTDSSRNLLSQESEIVQLRQELQQLQRERDEKEARIRELTRIIDKCNQCEMENDVIKKISNLLESLRGESDVEQFWIFSHLFAAEDNAEMNEKLEQLDRCLQDILQANASNRLKATQRQLHKLIRSREKDMQRYQQELRIEKWQRRMKVKIIKLNFSSILSRFFIRSRQKSQTQMLDLFNQLEDRYKDVLLKLTSQQ